MHAQRMYDIIIRTNYTDYRKWLILSNIEKLRIGGIFCGTSLCSEVFRDRTKG